MAKKPTQTAVLDHTYAVPGTYVIVVTDETNTSVSTTFEAVAPVPLEK